MKPQTIDKKALEGLGADVVTPGEENWDEARQAWNLTADQHPSAVVYAESADEVAALPYEYTIK